MKTFILLALAASASLAARIETVKLDLERPQLPFAINLTEATEATVSVELLASGSEFNPAGWTGLLWYGSASGGQTLTNATAGFGLMTWIVPVTAMPTNGRYSVQILGAISNRVEEWGRGALTVRLNPSRDTLPAQWMSGNVAFDMATQVQASLTGHLAATNPHSITPSMIGAATPAQIASAIAALPAPSTDALRLIGTGTNTWLDIAGSNAVIYSGHSVTVSNVSEISFDGNFYTRFDDVPPPGVPQTVPFPWTYPYYTGTWSAFYDGSYYVYVTFNSIDHPDDPCVWQGESPGELRDGTVLSPLSGDSGLATLHIVHAGTSVVTSRVDVVARVSDINRATNSLASAASVASLSQSVASVQSVLGSNQWITIDSVPVSASRIMVATGILQTTDTNGIVDLWRLIPARIWSVYSASGLYDGSSSQMYRIDPGSTIALPSYMQFPSKSELFFETGPIYFGFNGTQVDMGYWGFTGTGDETSFTVSPINAEFFTGTADFSSVVIPNVFYATNHIARLASTNDVNAQIAAYLIGSGYTSTNDVNDAIAAWMQSNEAGQWVAGAASSAAQSAVANHTNSPTHLITGDRALIDSISGKVSIADKEFHADSYTNLVWRSVFSNGWVWLQAYTNTP